MVLSSVSIANAQLIKASGSDDFPTLGLTMFHQGQSRIGGTIYAMMPSMITNLPVIGDVLGGLSKLPDIVLVGGTLLLTMRR